MPEKCDWVNWRQDKRRQLINIRQALTASQRLEAEQQIQKYLLSLITPMPVGVISFYMPIHGEINCQPVIESLLAKGWRAALPKILTKNTALQFRQWTNDSEMQPEIWQIPVPQDTAELIPDVLLIPLVGFDINLHRLGNGGGFYDRSLAAIQPKPLAVGIGLESLKLNDIQPQTHDIAMDIVVTEQAIYQQAAQP